MDTVNESSHFFLIIPPPNVSVCTDRFNPLCPRVEKLELGMCGFFSRHHGYDKTAEDWQSKKGHSLAGHTVSSCLWNIFSWTTGVH